MIGFYFGENTYSLEQALNRFIGERVAERVDGEELEIRDLPDIFAGQTLFADERLVVIRDASVNIAVWNEIERYLSITPVETTIIFIETKPDKRTRTYKTLQQVAEVHEFILPRNMREAELFLTKEAEELGVKMEPETQSTLLARVGYEPWNLVHALEKLAMVDGRVDTSLVEKLTEASPEAQVFGLFDAALSGDIDKVRDTIAALALGENAHQVFGFLSGQVVQLSALITADSSDLVVKDLGASPFIIRKLESHTAKLSRSGLKRIIATLADCDIQLKSSSQDPWLLIETGLIKVAAYTNK